MAEAQKNDAEFEAELEAEFDADTERKLGAIQRQLGVGREKALLMAVDALHLQCTTFQEWLHDEDREAARHS